MNCAIGTTFRDRVGRLLACGLRRVLRSNSEGSALVEMAFAAPFMMLMITGMTSYGLLLNSYLTLSHATDVGARALAVSRNVSTTPCSDAVTAIENAAPNLSKTGLKFTISIGTGSFSSDAGNISGSSGCDSSNQIQPGKTAIVTVTYPYSIFVYGWTSPDANMQSSTAEIIQ